MIVIILIILWMHVSLVLKFRVLCGVRGPRKNYLFVSVFIDFSVARSYVLPYPYVLTKIKLRKMMERCINRSRNKQTTIYDSHKKTKFVSTLELAVIILKATRIREKVIAD